MTAIRATFSDFKLVRSRKVAQLVMEVPLEDADAALTALGGIPKAATEQWVGIAPITAEAAAAPRKSWEQIPASQQAGIRCGDPEFRAWLGARSADDAATMLRERLGIKTRADIAPGSIAEREWRLIDSEFRARGIA